MAMTTCKDCGNEISKKAKSCPSCGAPRGPKQYSLGKLIVLVVFGVFIYSLFSTEDTTNRPAAQSASALPVSVAQKLAAIDNNGSRVSEYDALLDSLTGKCQESRIGVSDVAVRGTQVMMEEKNISISAMELLQAMDKSIPNDSTLNLKCAEIAASLIVMTDR